MPKESLLGKIGKSLIKSEVGFGQSIASAAGSTILSKERKGLEETNATARAIQQNLTRTIQEKRKKGEDVSRLLNALKTMDSEVNFYDILNTSTGNSLDKSAKQVLGEAAGVVTDIAGFGALPGKVGQIAKAKSLGQGIIQGAKTGAIGGAIFGSAQGAASAAQEDKGIGEIAGSGVREGLVGGAAGGVLGGVLGGISGGIAGRKVSQENKKTFKLFEALTPETKDLTPTEYESLLLKKKITPKTLTSPAKYILSDAEKATAIKYKGIIKSPDPVKNSIAIVDELAKKDTEVGSFLRKNNGIFNGGELKNHIRSSIADITDVSIPEARINKLKTTLTDNFIKALPKNDMETLWKARKAFDRSIEKAFSGSPSLQKEIKIEFRNAVQDFIAARTPKGVYQGYMKDMRGLYSLADVVTTKADKQKGRNAIQAWIKANPTKAKVIGGATTLLGGAGAYQLLQ